jgi:hypothetical protein
VPAWGDVPQAVPVDGEPFPAKLATVDADWQVTLDSAGKLRTLPAAELVRWGDCAEARRGPILVLADGGLLVADVLGADKEQLAADSDAFGLVKLPLEWVRGVVFRMPADRRAGELLLDAVASAEGDGDRVTVVNGDQLVGRLETIRDDVLRLEADFGPVEIESHRLRALVLNPALVTLADHKGLHAVCGFRDGSRVAADRLVVQGDSVKLRAAGGRAWTAPREDLVFLQFFGGRVTYLSDMKVADHRHLAYLDLRWPYRTDRNVAGGRLRAGGRLYLKGMGVHSTFRLTYNLAGPYRRLQAELAIDDSTGGRGSVRFLLFLDRESVYVSETVRGGSPPVPVSIDLNAAKRLDLVVDFADRADELDHANWLDARLVR